MSALSKTSSNGKVTQALDLMGQGFDLNTHEVIKATCANTRIAIEALGITCQYDVFRDMFLVGGHSISMFAGEISDNACLYIRQMIDQQFGFDPGKEKMQDAASQLCLENQIDPVAEYLDGLKWDRVSASTCGWSRTPAQQIRRSIEPSAELR